MLPDRKDRLDGFLDREQLGAVWFGTPGSFAWLTGGDNIISSAAPVGCAAAGYFGGSVTVVTSQIERDRLRDEELPEEVIVEGYPWYDSTLPEAVAKRTPEPAAADFDVPGLADLDIGTLRQPLSRRDQRLYEKLGRETAAAVEGVATSIRRTDTEREVAAKLAEALQRRGIRAPVLLVGGSERAQSYRHYTVSGSRLEDYALLSVVGERDGLHTSCTRAVTFDPPRWFDRRSEAATRVEATALAATAAAGRTGGTAGDVFGAIQDAYRAVDYEDEWKQHHQGGAIGYAPREWKATPESEIEIELPMAFAYNPTVRGAKSEGTWIVTEDGIESLTAPGADWPTTTVTAVDHDISLELPAPLNR